MADEKNPYEGMSRLIPAIAVDGCGDAIEFWKQALGAEVIDVARDPSGEKIWHAMLRINGQTVFANDTFPERQSLPKTARLWLYVDDVDGAFKRAVDAGGTSRMEPADMFWGDRIAEVHDRWGNEWVFAHHVRDMTADDEAKAKAEWQAATKK